MAQNLSFQASSFVNNEGGPPRTGQFFIAIDPRAFLGERFEPRLETLLQAIEADADVRLPGDKRLAARAHAQTHGVSIDADLYERISALGREH